MKVLTVLALFLVVFSATTFASDGQRYVYNENQQIMIDTQAGKVYRFFRDGSDIKHAEIDFVTGLVKVNGSLRASGSFDYRDAEEQIILAKV